MNLSELDEKREILISFEAEYDLVVQLISSSPELRLLVHLCLEQTTTSRRRTYDSCAGLTCMQ